MTLVITLNVVRIVDRRAHMRPFVSQMRKLILPLAVGLFPDVPRIFKMRPGLFLLAVLLGGASLLRVPPGAEPVSLLSAAVSSASTAVKHFLGRSC